MKKQKIFRAELKSILPITDTYEWSELIVNDVYNGSGWFTLNIGIYGEEASDIFDVMVSTPRALGNVRRSIKSKKCFVVEKFDRQTIENTLSEYINSITGKDWLEIVNQLLKNMKWEYEGMG